MGIAHEQNIALARRCNELLLHLKCKFHISCVHHVFSNAGTAENECADVAASLGMNGFLSESNVPSFWPDRIFLVQHRFEVPHCLTQIAEFFCTPSLFSCRRNSALLHLSVPVVFSQSPFVAHNLFVVSFDGEGGGRSPSVWECHVPLPCCDHDRGAYHDCSHGARSPEGVCSRQSPAKQSRVGFVFR